MARRIGSIVDARHAQIVAGSTPIRDMRSRASATAAIDLLVAPGLSKDVIEKTTNLVGIPIRDAGGISIRPALVFLGP